MGLQFEVLGWLFERRFQCPNAPALPVALAFIADFGLFPNLFLSTGHHFVISQLQSQHFFFLTACVAG
jgi:hypothetical protein